MRVSFPDGKRFAFTVFDDTDVATLEYIRPLYDLLHDLGLRTTKTVWPLDYVGDSPYAGSTSMEEPDYCEYLQLLQRRGFEIAFHGARMETSLREDTRRALDLFRSVLGSGPTSYAAHAQNRDNLYWGAERFHFALWRRLYRLMSRQAEPEYGGHVPGSDVYWMDLAPEIRYVRSFTYAGIDLNAITSAVPYFTPHTPGVRGWFPSCDADNVQEFVELLSPANRARLEARGGVCIVSTHFGKGFVRGGAVREDVARALDALSKQPGWFVPVTPLLDHLAAQRGIARLSAWSLFRLEAMWFLHSLLRRRVQRSYEATEVPYLRAQQARVQARAASQRPAAPPT